MRSRRWAGVGMALIVLSWGANYVITKIGVGRLAPVDFVFWRFLGTSVVTLPWMVKAVPHTRRDIVGLALMGLVGVSLYQWLFSTALHLTLSANVAFLFNLSPLLTLIWQRLTRKANVGSHMWWGAALSFVGVALLAGASIKGGYLGDLFAILAAGSWSAFAVMTDRFQVSVKGLAQTGWISIVGAIGVLPFVSFEPVWRMGTATWMPLLYTIFFVTVMGLSLWQNAVETAGAGRASLMLYIIPLVAALAGWIILGERLSVGEGVGAIAILVGVAWADGRLSFRGRGPGDTPGMPEVQGDATG